MIDAVQTRLEDHGRRLSAIEAAQPAVTKSEVDGLKDDLRDVKDELLAVKRALYGVALSVMAAALIFAATANSLWGGGP